MKALTIRHPWPWAVCYLGKPIENRTWRPSQDQLAPGEKFAIHAGKMPSADEIEDAFDCMLDMGAIAEDTKLPTMDELRTQESAFVAVVTFGGTVTESDSPWFCGPFGWVLSNVLILPEPVHWRGARGLWDVPPDALSQMRRQFGKRQSGSALASGGGP